MDVVVVFVVVVVVVVDVVVVAPPVVAATNAAGGDVSHSTRGYGKQHAVILEPDGRPSGRVP